MSSSASFVPIVARVPFVSPSAPAAGCNSRQFESPSPNLGVNYAIGARLPVRTELQLEPASPAGFQTSGPTKYATKSRRTRISQQQQQNGNSTINNKQHKANLDEVGQQDNQQHNQYQANQLNQHQEELARMRERLFRLLSKVPIQVDSVRLTAAAGAARSDFCGSPATSASTPTGSSSSNSSSSGAGNSSQGRVLEREPLLIKYYNERSLNDILELHFNCSLLKHNFEQTIDSEPFKALQVGRDLASSSAAGCGCSSSCQPAGEPEANHYNGMIIQYSAPSYAARCHQETYPFEESVREQQEEQQQQSYLAASAPGAAADWEQANSGFQSLAYPQAPPAGPLKSPTKLTSGNNHRQRSTSKGGATGRQEAGRRLSAGRRQEPICEQTQTPGTTILYKQPYAAAFAPEAPGPQYCPQPQYQADNGEPFVISPFNQQPQPPPADEQYQQQLPVPVYYQAGYVEPLEGWQACGQPEQLELALQQQQQQQMIDQHHQAAEGAGLNYEQAFYPPGYLAAGYGERQPAGGSCQQQI